MEDFLKKMESELDKKILACMKGQTIVKPFDTVFEEVRHRPKKIREHSEKKYSKEEESIYKAVVEQFLKENPELMSEIEENK